MTNTCEACGSDELQLMGTLGSIVWLKCRDCGWQQEAEPIDQEIFEDMTNAV